MTQAVTSGGARVLATAQNFATRASTAAALQAGNLSSISTIAGRIACTFYIVSDALAVANDPSIENLATLAVDAVGCGVKPVSRPKPAPKKPPTCPLGNSFDGDTMVWIKEGLKAIRDIKAGDEVLAWDPVAKRSGTVQFMAHSYGLP